MKNNQIFFSVVVCTKNCIEKDLEFCLKKINKQLNKKCEFFLIENISDKKIFSQNKLDILINNCGSKYLEVNYSNLAGSRNLALDLSKGSYLVFIDDDVRIDDNFFKKIKISLNFLPRLSALTMRFIPLRKKNIWSNYFAYYWHDGFFEQNKIRRVLCQPMAAAVLNLSIFRNNNLKFDLSLDTGEDIDSLIRVNNVGGSVYYNPLITNYHDFPKNIKEFVFKFINYSRFFPNLHLKNKDNYGFDQFSPSKIFHFIFFPLFLIKNIIFLSEDFLKRNRLGIKYLPLSIIHYTTVAFSLVFDKEGRIIYKDKFFEIINLQIEIIRKKIKYG
jgi:hypothetical protein